MPLFFYQRCFTPAGVRIATPYRRSRAGKRVKEKIKKLQVLVTQRRPRVKSPVYRNSIKQNLILVARKKVLANSNIMRLMKFCLLNTRSVKNKTSIIKHFIVDGNIDVASFTETWLQPSDGFSVGSLCPGHTFCMLHSEQSMY